MFSEAVRNNLRASWKIAITCTYFVCAKCSYPQKIKALLTYLLTYYLIKVHFITFSFSLSLIYSLDRPRVSSRKSIQYTIIAVFSEAVPNKGTLYNFFFFFSVPNL